MLKCIKQKVRYSFVRKNQQKFLSAFKVFMSGFCSRLFFNSLKYFKNSFALFLPSGIRTIFCSFYFISLTTLSPADPVTAETFSLSLVKAAIERTKHVVRYDGSYRKMSYPMGDVPDDVGVCSDLIIRAYRALSIDLQKLVHVDMLRYFHKYPGLWNLKQADRNIDHRRVPNLQKFFERHGKVLPITQNKNDYGPGDVVTWMLPGNLPHIGIVTDRKTRDTNALLIVHNIGSGPRLEDMLFKYKITGHYRYSRTMALKIKSTFQ